MFQLANEMPLFNYLQSRPKRRTEIVFQSRMLGRIIPVGGEDAIRARRKLHGEKRQNIFKVAIY
jgi:hypothetical protein